MAEYLAPGVYVEERPGQRTIEGVSTSTAGFVGMTERGPVKGFPILVASLNEFQRVFGGYLPLNESESTMGVHGYLPIAIQQFFENGGKRAFISRAFKSTKKFEEDDLRRIYLRSGVVARLRASAPKDATTLYLTTLRGFDKTVAKLFRDKDHETSLLGDPDLASGKVTCPALADEHRADTAFVRISAAIGKENEGTELRAREPGLWGEDVGVEVRPTNGPLADILAAVTPANAEGDLDTRNVTVGSSVSFYLGATVELSWNKKPVGTPPVGELAFVYGTVTKIVGNVLTVIAKKESLKDFNEQGTANHKIAVAEVNVSVTWRALSESFTGSWWSIRATASIPWLTDAQKAEFNAAHSVWHALQRGSQLVKLDTESNGDLKVKPFMTTEPLASHPTTPTGARTTLGPAPTRDTEGRQEVDTATGDYRLAARGDADDVPGIPEYVGNPGAGPGDRTGIAALEDEEDISIVAVPGITNESIQGALLGHAQRMKYRFAVLDGPHDADIARIRLHRSNFDSTYGAIYYPWVQIAHPQTGSLIKAPPSGLTIGVYARVDGERGVFKAPANEVALGARDVLTRVLTGEQEVLNPEGINVIRDFRPHNRGIRIWGARTISSDPQWKYINVRRLFLYLERSIDEGTQWVVFEPNNIDLWGRVRRTIEAFLESEWRKGALLGATAADAFYVKCDRTTMTPQEIANGQLVCEIGIVPTRPAEFVIFRIAQLTADARTAN
ncbi:phage tail sheath subtilisin-like domain-containing protein [Pendulispora brunnea]|uniref:Phage tail sheath subtilisin-like domain-containing protein n=1 Tax=Pendulispora brunnea TaxID=2905690 RepID=A0ABZ2KP16_9BACT